jgi:hypothetical protein
MGPRATERSPLVALCERLTGATVAREAEWKSEGDDVYAWKRSEGAVTIASRDCDGEPPYELTVRNAIGEVVDELASDLGADDEPAPWNDALSELYRAARRNAKRADEVIDALAQALPPTAEELAGVES